jgi:hypothetical protein
MQALEAHWGKHWPKVFEQLVTDGKVSGTAYVVGTMNRLDQALAAERLAIVAGPEAKKALEERLTGTAKSDLEKNVLGEMEQFGASMAGLPGSVGTFSTFKDAIQTLATAYHVEDSMDLASAARAAYEDVLGKKYNIVDAGGGTVRVPKDYDAFRVVTGAQTALAGVTVGGLRPVASLTPGLAEEAAQEQYLSALKAQGFWRTSPDESGLDLYDGAHHIVLRPDGTPFTLTWDELLTTAASSPSAGAVDEVLRPPGQSAPVFMPDIQNEVPEALPSQPKKQAAPRPPSPGSIPPASARPGSLDSLIYRR